MSIILPDSTHMDNEVEQTELSEVPHQLDFSNDEDNPEPPQENHLTTKDIYMQDILREGFTSFKFVWFMLMAVFLGSTRVLVGNYLFLYLYKLGASNILFGAAVAVSQLA